MNAVNSSRESGITAFFFLKCLLFSYVITGAILVVLTFLLYKFGISQDIVKISIIVTYVLSTFAAGYIVGKRMSTRKYIWGAVMGILYFAILAVMSLIVNKSVSALGDSFLTTLILCTGGGMLGGMFS